MGTRKCSANLARTVSLSAVAYPWNEYGTHPPSTLRVQDFTKPITGVSISLLAPRGNDVSMGKKTKKSPRLSRFLLRSGGLLLFKRELSYSAELWSRWV
jgi:hypothetical protein